MPQEGDNDSAQAYFSASRWCTVRNMSRQILITVLMLIASGSYVRSQIRTRVDLVVVPVSVKDAKGKLVTGLTKDDFIVREDGKVQTITNFDTDPQPLSVAICRRRWHEREPASIPLSKVVTFSFWSVVGVIRSRRSDGRLPIRS